MLDCSQCNELMGSAMDRDNPTTFGRSERSTDAAMELRYEYPAETAFVVQVIARCIAVWLSLIACEQGTLPLPVSSSVRVRAVHR